jgi:hypothetical protein
MTAVKAMARRRPGKAKRMSTTLMRISSNQPPRYPEIIPTNAPNVSERRTTKKLIERERRAE